MVLTSTSYESFADSVVWEYLIQIFILVIALLLGLIVGAVIGFFVSKKLMTKYLKQNPPINEEMIKTLMRGMGRNPSQKQVNQLMKQMQKYQ